MDEQVQQLADQLQWQVTDADAGQGRYQWADGADPDAEVVGFLVTHYRSSSVAIADLEARLQATEAALADAIAPPPIEVVEVPATEPGDLADVAGPDDA